MVVAADTPLARSDEPEASMRSTLLIALVTGPHGGGGIFKSDLTKTEGWDSAEKAQPGRICKAVHKKSVGS